MSGTGTSWAIDLQHVSKTYRGRIRALDGVELQVAPGEIFGLLGPNGAGKSTLVKILVTVVRPTLARGAVLGRPIGHRGTMSRIGYLPEDHRFPGYLRGWQVLDHYGALSGVPRAIRRRRTEELLELVGMTRWRDTPVSRYSKGMLQRVGLAQALIHQPRLLLLDEPTDGLDPLGRREIRDLLGHLREQGCTVFINSHILSELEMVCTRVAILVGGRVTRQGTLEELLRDTSRYELEVEGGTTPRWLTSCPGVQVVATDHRLLLVVAGADPQPVQELIDRLRADDRPILRVQPRTDTLEDLLVTLLEPGERAP